MRQGPMSMSKYKKNFVVSNLFSAPACRTLTSFYYSAYEDKHISAYKNAPVYKIKVAKLFAYYKYVIFK